MPKKLLVILCLIAMLCAISAVVQATPSPPPPVTDVKIYMTTDYTGKSHFVVIEYKDPEETDFRWVDLKRDPKWPYHPKWKLGPGRELFVDNVDGLGGVTLTYTLVVCGRGGHSVPVTVSITVPEGI